MSLMKPKDTLLQINHVFKPEELPNYTYFTRISHVGLSYEFMLKHALSIKGYLTVIVGSDKIGKKVLCEKVVGKDSLVPIFVSDIKCKENFWLTIAIRVGLTNKCHEDSSLDENYTINKEKVIDYFVENQKVLLLNDFCNSSSEMQVFIAQQVKDAMRRELKVIITFPPQYAENLCDFNPDLQGRMSLVYLSDWNREELQLIPRVGFNMLGLTISEEDIDEIVNHCHESPQLVQQVCLRICTLMNLGESNARIVRRENIKRAFELINSN